MMNGTATYAIPLAPPAPQPTTRLGGRNTAPIAVTWREWLSPKLVPNQHQQHRPRGGRYDSDDEDQADSSPHTTLRRHQQRRRHRSASFDLTPTATNRTRLSNAVVSDKDGGEVLPPFGGRERISKSVYAPAGPNARGKPHRGDKFADGAREISSHSSNFLLATFLLRLDSLLPEYCTHLSLTTEDTLLSMREASKAIDALEKNSNADHHLHHDTMARNRTGAAKSPMSSPVQSPSLGNVSAPCSPAHSPTKTLANELRHWLSPQYQRMSMIGMELKWKSKAKSQWERFVSPFFSLIAAECMYARMEHVLDPTRCSTSTATGGRGESSCDRKKTLVPGAKDSSFAFPPPPLSPADTSKRGSRRLITIYRQIRDELVIVGEYLVDPFIGARFAGGGDTATPPSVSSECNTAVGQRELAAASLRTTLDALISFIEARVVLIRIHAELCFFQAPSSPHLLNDEGCINGLCGQSTTRDTSKWTALAQQCHTLYDPVSAFAANAEEVCAPQRAVSNIRKELKCLELMLICIGYMVANDLFNCVVNVRRLHVLLGTISYRRTCLPILYIDASLPELLAIMHIYFANAAGMDMTFQNVAPISPRQPSTTTSLRSTLLEKASSNRRVSLGKKSNKSTDFDCLFTEFTDGPIADIFAVALVRRTGEIQEPSVEEGQQSKDAEETKHPDSSWIPLYMKCRELNHLGMNALSDGGMGAKWAHIEKVLTNHCSSPSTADTLKHAMTYAADAGGFVRRNCHVMTVTDSICLFVIQGVSSQGISEGASVDKIQDFLRVMVSKLSPEHLLGIRAVVDLKSEIFAKAVNDEDHSHKRNNNRKMASLWSEFDWSNDQGKKVLHSLGLRRSASPVIPPLKSPYVNRKIRQLGGRQRMKRMKSSLNHGHLAFFLGPELSKMPIPTEFDFIIPNRK